MTCHSGGSLSVYVEPVFPRPLIVVMGNSPVAISLLKMSSELGYETLWTVNPEKENETLEVDRIQKTFDLKNINLSSPCFIIVCTQGENDWEALESAMKTSVNYVAFVGSRRKTETLKKELLENGVSSDRLGKMVNPAGLDLKARTPSEIALSILAEIVQLLRDDNTLDNQVVSESEEKAIDPVCGMKVDTELTKNTFQFKNQDYHFCCNGCKTKFKNNPELFLIAS
jgi:xanthine dehydrogenase accessory factor